MSLRSFFEKLDTELKNIQIKAQKYDAANPILKSIGQSFVESKKLYNR